jgi:hypothetical protein
MSEGNEDIALALDEESEEDENEDDWEVVEREAGSEDISPVVSVADKVINVMKDTTVTTVSAAAGGLRFGKACCHVLTYTTTSHMVETAHRVAPGAVTVTPYFDRYTTGEISVPLVAGAVGALVFGVPGAVAGYVLSTPISTIRTQCLGEGGPAWENGM